MSDGRYAISGIAALLVVCLTILSGCGSESSVSGEIENDVQSEQANDSYDEDMSDTSETEAEYQIEDCDGLCIYNEKTGKVTLLPRFYTQLEVGGIVELNGNKCEPEKMKHYYDSYDYYSCWTSFYSATQNDDFVDFDKTSGDILIYVSNESRDYDTFHLWSPKQFGYWDGQRTGNYDRTFLDELMGETVTNASSDVVQRILKEDGLSPLRIRANGITQPGWTSFESEDTSSMYIVSDEKAQYAWAQYQGTKYVEAYNDVVIPYILSAVGKKMGDEESVDLEFISTRDGYFKIDVNSITSDKIWCGGGDTDDTGRWTRCFKSI